MIGEPKVSSVKPRSPLAAAGAARILTGSPRRSETSAGKESAEDCLLRDRAQVYRNASSTFNHWAEGIGVISHEPRTQVRVYEMAQLLKASGAVSSADECFKILAAADRVASAAMWLIVHMTYARKVYTDGREMSAADFKAKPEGHTGGSLNMAPAYAGYLAINALTGITRSWLMGQGHCVAAIDAVNSVVGNLEPRHAERYGFNDAGLTRLVNDFYSYAIGADGRPESPIGSHVNAHTAGGMIEGGYLGFAELQYAHMPLPGERLVAFLSDGAFEEQRGADWAPRWWRARDCGFVAPILIANGRRIDQRTSLGQQEDTHWMRKHLELHHFKPIEIDGRDPAAFAWAIFQSEDWLAACSQAPALLPYTIATAPKGYGFPGAGTNLAHNLPLGENPSKDALARSAFNEGARRLWIKPSEVAEAVQALNNHSAKERPYEKDHPLAARQVELPALPKVQWPASGAQPLSPMAAADKYFVEILKANPQLRPRVGNPDEMRSNQMGRTLDFLKHRVTDPEPEVAESVYGGVITALNEEAVVCAALGNKGGINLVASYEAFAAKMLGALRQEITFSRGQREAGRKPGWLSVPLFLTSHAWENGKNEQSHQDPVCCETLLGEMSDVSRVLFPADGGTAQEALRRCYSSRGEIWSLVTPKNEMPQIFTEAQARTLFDLGAVRLHGSARSTEKVILAATGAYQLREALKASERLQKKKVPHSLVYILEPARFREPRDGLEAAYVTSAEEREKIFPSSAPFRVVMGHCRPQVLSGVLRPLDTCPSATRFLGFINQGGTLNVDGMLFANRCTWAHAVQAVADLLHLPPERLLTKRELLAVANQTAPQDVLF